MDIKARVHEIHPTENVTETFKRRSLIVEYAENPTYPEYIKFEALQDKISLFDGLNVGDDVEVFFNLRGRPWTDKNGKTSHFNSLVVWRLNKVSGEQKPQHAPPVDISSAPDDDTLPF